MESIDSATPALPLFFLASQSFAATYRLSDNVVGSKLYSSFTFENISDPTNGRVNYVDQATAIANNLSYTCDDSIVLRADHTTVLDPAGPGRNSVRVKSVATYTKHVLILDVRHIPQGCATWPAAWETEEANWPNGGELDIIEGANGQGPDGISIHTGPGCTIPASGDQTGTLRATDCNALDNGGAGCGFSVEDANSYGAPFNSNGGGWYAMERTDTFIKVWFWPRNGCPPFDVLADSIYVNTDTWGTPAANFPNTYCDIGKEFGPNNIIINLTFCGGYANGTFSSDGCPGSCIDYVNNNPGDFVDAYWEFASLRVYE